MERRTLRYGDLEVAIEGDPDRPLLEVLRAELSIRSASRACQDGSCGACRVILDGTLVASCRVSWKDVRDGAVVEAYEQLASDPAATRAVDFFAEERPSRCRMCVGALGVTAVAIARAARSGTTRDEAIEDALKDATCMCTGRGSWRRALTK